MCMCHIWRGLSQTFIGYGMACPAWPVLSFCLLCHLYKSVWFNVHLCSKNCRIYDCWVLLSAGSLIDRLRGIWQSKPTWTFEDNGIDFAWSCDVSQLLGFASTYLNRWAKLQCQLLPAYTNKHDILYWFQDLDQWSTLFQCHLRKCNCVKRLNQGEARQDTWYDRMVTLHREPYSCWHICIWKVTDGFIWDHSSVIKANQSRRRNWKGKVWFKWVDVISMAFPGSVDHNSS